MNMTQQQESIQSLQTLLRSISSSPSTYLNNNVLIESLSSQGKLCRLEDKDLKIYKTSLNTFKRHCEAFIPGGFTHINQLRNGALIAIRKSLAQCTTKRKSQKQKIAELTLENSQLNLDLLMLTKLLRLSMRQTKLFALRCDNSAASALYAKEHRELLDMLSSVGNVAKEK